MTTQDIANRLYELCRDFKTMEAKKELYAADATSTESDQTGIRQTVTGTEAIKAKGEQFISMVEAVHGTSVEEPTVFGNYIFMEMGMDMTMKGMGRLNIKEMCKYEVKGGKIISEEFFY